MNTEQKIAEILMEYSSPAIMTPNLKGQKVILLEWGQLTPQLIGDIKEVIKEIKKEAYAQGRKDERERLFWQQEKLRGLVVEYQEHKQAGTNDAGDSLAEGVINIVGSK